MQVYYRCHIICFIGFYLFACWHYYYMWAYFTPGDSPAGSLPLPVPAGWQLRCRIAQGCYAADIPCVIKPIVLQR